MTDFARARRTMVDNQLRTRGITDWRILDVMNRVPREVFVPAYRHALAYIDENIQLSPTRTMLAPVSLARLIQLAEIGADDSVLDVGCGSGYSVAVLAGLCAKVIGVEPDTDLAAKAEEALRSLDLANASVLAGALEAGASRHAPFDVIVLEGAVDVVPEPLLGQLADGGRLIAVLGRGNAAVAHVFVRSGKDISSRTAFNISLPSIGAFTSEPVFAF